MRSLLRWSVVMLLGMLLIPAGIAQVATGVYPYGTFDNQGFDTINVANLNVHFAIPILNKAGRGLPFYYNLSYDSSIWVPTTINGSTVWNPVQNFGWRGDTEIETGYVSYQSDSFDAGSGGTGRSGQCPETDYFKFVYHDPFGIAHYFPDVATELRAGSTCGTSTQTSSGVANDGSGYTLNVTNFTVSTITSRTGKSMAVPIANNGSATATDPNGNQISADGAGHFTDTTGNVVLTVAGSAPNPHTFSYTDTTGTARFVTMTYKTYTVQTDFNCGFGEYGPTSTSLVDTVSFADGSTYKFTYEETPNGTGNVTGRIASVELPQGGTINYTYSGGSNGINCADGSTAGLTRTLSADSGSAASTWTYTRSDPNGANTTHTEVVDGLSNHKTYDFVQVPVNTANQIAGLYFETSRRVYQGAENGSPVVARSTCYNGATSPCVSTSVAFPISQIDTYETLDGLVTHGATTKFNSYGSRTQADIYDFGTSGRGPLLQEEKWTYGGSIVGLPTLDQVFDGGGNLAGQTSYAYDGATLTTSSGVPQHIAEGGARGNLTNETLYASSSTSYSINATYEDTGSILTSAGPTGTTSYSYDNSFVYLQGTTLPTPSSGVALSTGAGYDTTYTGLPTSKTDMNTQSTNYVSYDEMLRLTQVNNPDGGTIKLGYSPTSITANVYQNSGAHSSSETQFDAYGRQSRTLIANGQSGNAYYEQDTCHDGDGNASFVSYSYAGTGASGSNCSTNGDTYTYDVLGRVLSIKHSDGTSKSYSYFGRAVQYTDENNVSRISQVDGLGRLTIVCEISSDSSMPGSGSPSSCGTDTPGTGFTTTYGYSLATRTTAINQGGQTRTFQTDWLGRPTSITEPESGTTTYSYAVNSTGLQVTRTRPTATTTTQFDSLGRVVSISYSDGTPAKTYVYDKSAGGNWSDLSQNFLKGRLSVAYVPNAGTAYSYDAMGRPTDLDECLPSGCGNTALNKHLHYTYDWEGNMLSSTDGAGVTSTYTVTPANELQSLTSSLSDTTDPPNLVSGVLSGPHGPISYNLGNGLSGGYSYDGLGRLNGGWVIHSGAPNWCYSIGKGYKFSLSWKGDELGSATDSILGRSYTYTYDKFDRIVAQTTTAGTTTQNMTWTYDRWGNRTAQTATNGPQPSFSINTANNEINGLTYDAVGELSKDAFQNTYTYDAEGNVIAVNGGGTAQYVYDALNHRVRTVVNGNAAEFVFNVAGQRVSIWNGSTQRQIEGQYYWGGKPVAYYSGGAIHFQHQDWVGTERLRTTYNGGVDGSFTSLPFGDSQASSGADTDAYHYAGLDYDYETSTDHAQFRQYSNSQGRWMSPDPYHGSYDFRNPQSFNRYAYVLNNPGSFLDPSGLLHCIKYRTCPMGNVSDDGTDPAGEFQMVPVGYYDWVYTSIFMPDQFVMGTATYADGTFGEADSRIGEMYSGWAYVLTGVGTNLDFTSASLSGYIPLASIGTIAAPNSPIRTPKVCGGTFAFGGVEGDAGEAGVFSGGVVEADNVDGYSGGHLGEAWGGGEVALAGGGKITSPSDTSVLQGLLGFAGVGLNAGPLAGFQVGYVAGQSWGGLYIEAHVGPIAGGAGGYLRDCKSGG